MVLKLRHALPCEALHLGRSQVLFRRFRPDLLQVFRVPGRTRHQSKIPPGERAATSWQSPDLVVTPGSTAFPRVSTSARLGPSLYFEKPARYPDGAESD